MKKFLTVLLVIAVMFTFSFSSAFAATATLAETTQASDYAKTAIEAKVDLIGLADTVHTTTAINYAKEQAVKIGTNNVVNDLIAVLNAKDSFTLANFKTELNNWVNGSPATYIGAITSVGTGTVVNYDMTYAKASLEALYGVYADAKEYSARIADAKAVVEAAKATQYSTKKYTVGGRDYTYATYAEKLIADALDAIDDVETTTTLKKGGADVYVADTSAAAKADYKAVLNAILYGYEYAAGTGGSGKLAADKIYVKTTYTALNKVTELPNSKSDTSKYVPGLLGLLNELLTVEEEGNVNAQEKVDLDHAKATFAYYAKTTYYNTVKVVEGGTTTPANDFYDGVTGLYAGVKVANATNLTKAEAAAINAGIIEDLNSTIEVVNVYLDEADDPVTDSTSLQTTPSFYTNVVAKALVAIDLYKVAEDKAAGMKAKVALDGTKTYADADVDAALAKDKIDIYSHFNVTYTELDYLGDVPTTSLVSTAIAEANAKWIPNVIYAGVNKTADADKKYCRDFYAAAFAADYDVIEAETKGALNDAKTVDEVNAIVAKADARLAELRTVAEDTTTLANAITKYKASLLDYATEQLKLLNSNDTSAVVTYRPDSFTDAASNNVWSAYEEGCDNLTDAKNVDALPAIYEAAKAEFKNIKTDAELKAEAAKVTELIGALPAAPAKDLSNEAQFLEAQEAFTAYTDLYGAQASDISGALIFEKKMDVLKGYQIAATTKAIDDIAKTSVGSDAYKAATAAASEMLEKYLELYDVNSATFDGTDDAYADGDVFNITAPKLRVLTAAKANVSAANVDAVEALIAKLTSASTEADIKAAREAYDALTGSEQRALGEGYAYKLAELEASYAMNDEAAKAYVQDLGIKARSTKTSKGVKITIKADVKELLDNGYTVEYKFYRSTKSNKGFKAMVTKTTGTYTNTKGVKGTKYYYKAKLVVKNAAGEVVATTPLTQCLYATRTF